MSGELHPWLSTPEAVTAAIQAVRVAVLQLPVLAQRAGTDELESEALVILTECALPPIPRSTSCGRCGGSLTGVRKGAKFCSKNCKNIYNRNVSRGKAVTLPDSPYAHIGVMGDWPEEHMIAYAVRTVGLVLCNWLKTSYRDDLVISLYDLAQAM